MDEKRYKRKVREGKERRNESRNKENEEKWEMKTGIVRRVREDKERSRERRMRRMKRMRTGIVRRMRRTKYRVGRSEIDGYWRVRVREEWVTVSVESEMKREQWRIERVIEN